MSFILYVAVLAVSITSVMIGLDWLSSPPPPVPKSVQTVKAPAKPAAPTKTASAKEAPAKTAPEQSAGTIGKANSASVVETEAAKSVPAKSAPVESTATETAAVSAAGQPDVAAAVPETAGSAPAGVADNPQASALDSFPNSDINESVVSGTAAQANAPLPRCDVQACEQRYISFTASDCTYQPFDGPRRLCTAGNPPSQAGDTPAGVQTSDASRQPAAPSCNYDACGEAYRSFDPGTCTYQPFEGPRRLCTK